MLKVLQIADSWQLYQPAKNYNAVVLVNEQGRQVRNLIFEEREQPQLTCPDGATPRVMP